MTFDEWCAMRILSPMERRAAKDAWNNRQALIDAHNERCEDECPGIEKCAAAFAEEADICGGLCSKCPRRLMIED